MMLFKANIYYIFVIQFVLEVFLDVDFCDIVYEGNGLHRQMYLRNSKNIPNKLTFIFSASTYVDKEELKSIHWIQSFYFNVSKINVEEPSWVSSGFELYLNIKTQSINSEKLKLSIPWHIRYNVATSNGLIRIEAPYLNFPSCLVHNVEVATSYELNSVVWIGSLIVMIYTIIAIRKLVIK